MRILVVGAGASIEECRRANILPEFTLPALRNFVGQFWNSSTFAFGTPLIAVLLQSQGIAPEQNIVAQFARLEADPKNGINIERLYELAWQLRKQLGTHAMDLVWHGIVRPISECILFGFLENNQWKPIPATPLVSKRLNDEDVVVNLNYDTLFEMGLTQIGRQFHYTPLTQKPESLWIAKPHGSINLILEKSGKGWFGQPEPGSPTLETESWEHFRGIVPPRLNKDYSGHPFAVMTWDGLKPLTPNVVTFWGVGFTESDVDLTAIYSGWLSGGGKVELINPDDEAAKRASGLLRVPVTHFKHLDDWLNVTV